MLCKNVVYRCCRIYIIPGSGTESSGGEDYICKIALSELPEPVRGVDSANDVPLRI